LKISLALLILSLIGDGSGQAGSIQKGVSMTRIATFAGGCFWCLEADFEKVPGVEKAISGYTGGHTENPSYEEVSTGTTGHAEAVQVYYDPSKITYQELLEFFWRHIDPTDPGGQFADRGSQYRTAIFYHDGPADSTNPLSPRSCPSPNSMRQRIITRITIKSSQPGTRYIDTAQAGIAFWGENGKKRRRSEKRKEGLPEA
jgi:peptide methionine sulfoxide reductase msrA/msrB